MSAPSEQFPPVLMEASSYERLLRDNGVPGVSAGMLDKPLELLTDGGPAALGFLGLTLELGVSTLRELATPLQGTFQVSWDFTDRLLIVHAVGKVTSHLGASLGLGLASSVTAENLAPGLLGVTLHRFPEPQMVYTRRARLKQETVCLALRLRMQPEARPIGSVPSPRNQMFEKLAV